MVSQTATTDSSGNYHFEQLPVGAYKITASAPGFQQYVRENIQVSAGFSDDVNVPMTVGQQTETVIVSAEGPVVDTSSTTVSTAVGATTVADEIPATRTMQQMVSIAPGVMPTAAPDLGGGNIASFTLSAYGILGQATTLIVRPTPGADDSIEWNSPPFEITRDFKKPPMVRHFKSLHDYSEATGQDQRSVLVDYIVFTNVQKPAMTDPQRVYKTEDFDFRLKPGSAAIDAGIVLPNITDDYTRRAPDLGAYEL